MTQINFMKAQPSPKSRTSWYHLATVVQKMKRIG
jgi:hypothetical protein